MSVIKNFPHRNFALLSLFLKLPGQILLFCGTNRKNWRYRPVIYQPQSHKHQVANEKMVTSDEMMHMICTKYVHVHKQ